MNIIAPKPGEEARHAAKADVDRPNFVKAGSGRRRGASQRALTAEEQAAYIRDRVKKGLGKKKGKVKLNANRGKAKAKAARSAVAGSF